VWQESVWGRIMFVGEESRGDQYPWEESVWVERRVCAGEEECVGNFLN